MELEKEKNSEPLQHANTAVGLKRTFLLLIFACIAYPIFISFPATKSLELMTARKIEYSIRDRLNMVPPVDPLIKMIVWDDKTSAYLNDKGIYSKDISLESWSKVFRAISLQGPTSIVMAGDFSMPYQPGGAASFIQAIEKSGSSVFFGALLSQEKLSGREVLNRSKGTDSKLGAKYSARFDPKKLFVYGAHTSLNASKAVKFGHQSIGDDGSFFPWVSMGGEKILPHIALRAFQPENSDFKVVSNGFQLNQRKIELDSRGRVLIDLPRPAQFSNSTNTISLSDVLKNVEQGKAVDFVHGGDYVLIFPHQVVGSAENRSTYAGQVEAGILNTVILSNALTGSWFSYFEGGWWFGLLMIFTGAALGLYLPAGAFATIFLGGLFLFVSGSIVAATQFKIIVSWLYPAFFYLFTGVVVFFETHRQSMIRTERLRSSLGGVLAPKQVKELIKQGGAVRPEPSEQFVSVVFVDIVGFSKIAEEARPKEVFAQLRILMIKMRNLVHEHGGVVDRSLGDGIVAFFGYDYTGVRQVKDHAEQALKCAMEMQLFSAKETVSAAKKGSSNVFPLRIGINTGLVFIGDLGDENRVDFTLIGHGVNMAQRLESASESFGVMVGAQTREAVKHNSVLIGLLERRVMQIKHHDDLLEAYELNSFAGQSELLKAAIDGYRSMHNLQRQTERHTPLKGSIEVFIQVSTSHGQGELVDFSLGGFSVKLDTFLARGVATQLTLDTKDGLLGENCREYGLFPVPVEVRWGVKVSSGYLHGVEIKGLNEVHKGLLHRELRGHTAGHGSSRRWSVPDGMPLFVVTSVGEGRVLNFSQSGIGLNISGASLAAGDHIDLDFDKSPSPLREIAAGAGIKKIGAVIRRADSSNGSVFYGIEILGSEEDKKLQLFRGLQSLVRPTKAA